MGGGAWRGLSGDPGPSRGRIQIVESPPDPGRFTVVLDLPYAGAGVEVSTPMCVSGCESKGKAIARCDVRVTGHLVAVLHSLPAGSGSITSRRVGVASEALRCGSHEIVNLYPAPLANIGALKGEGDFDVWKLGREQIAEAVRSDQTSAILLGYGLQEPAGPQRYRYREQLEWLQRILVDIPVDVWTFGGRPAHPSRWQRVAHRHSPGASVRELATTLLQRYPIESASKFP